MIANRLKSFLRRDSWIVSFCRTAGDVNKPGGAFSSSNVSKPGVSVRIWSSIRRCRQVGSSPLPSGSRSTDMRTSAPRKVGRSMRRCGLLGSLPLLAANILLILFRFNHAVGMAQRLQNAQSSSCVIFGGLLGSTTEAWQLKMYCIDSKLCQNAPFTSFIHELAFDRSSIETCCQDLLKISNMPSCDAEAAGCSCCHSLKDGCFDATVRLYVIDCLGSMPTTSSSKMSAGVAFHPIFSWYSLLPGSKSPRSGKLRDLTRLSGTPSPTSIHT
mmetsp:Transcript_18442/g.47282  ORF Transcript_18442/g.47282 Transcript_18442/m.47282 type:complete len:271 (+) Transcript_18442:539-1351(+)